jgi:phage tail sheath protein FI
MAGRMPALRGTRLPVSFAAISPRSRSLTPHYWRAALVFYIARSLRRPRGTPLLMPTSLQTPGVYVQELDAFPNAVVPVATAVPAFIGYTPAASFNGQSILNQAVRVSSWADFQTYFGRRDAGGSALLAETDQYRPVFFAVAATAPTTAASAEVTLGGRSYTLQPDAGTIYHLYNSLKLFYANGGGTCFVVAVGLMDGAPLGVATSAGSPLVNPHVTRAALAGGLAVAAAQAEVTMLAVPDAVLLSAGDYENLSQAMLTQCGELQSRFALLDVPGGRSGDPGGRDQAIAAFRTGIGINNLSYGCAYFPFLHTSVMTALDVDYRNVGGGAAALTAVLPPLTGAPAAALAGLIAQTENPGTQTPAQIDAGLRTTSADYAALGDAVLAAANLLPPSGALAGVYTTVDNNSGVWVAPANVSLNAVLAPTQVLSDTDQDPLNVDPATGKSINVIRLFAGRGTIVWGARTLDGNSGDWRYVPARRTMIYIEQSIKQLCAAYVFSPNTASTWAAVTSQVNSFLTSLWSQGGLAGSTAAAAFSVTVGLGSTMTADDMLNGRMNVVVRVALMHPAEFVVITIQQQLATA